ncbi:zinc finger and BTB domain-containing protein 32 [Tenrec ecaudatus]|uniref:zinc finger and BTB domain-containing protein 32 n=1 Tax=Tenrec ecaudatus TaxID=94439 RepID=UPI003F5A64C8
MPLPLTRLPSPYSSDRLVQLAARLWPALCDTLITVGSKDFPVHSLVLAGASQQLCHRGRWVLVDGISPATFVQLLHFVYGASVELQPGELGPLEEAARVLGVQALEAACRSARRGRAKEQQEPGLKTQGKEPGTPSRDSEGELGGLGEKQSLGCGESEPKPLPKHRLPRESSGVAKATQEGRGVQMRSQELSQTAVDHGGVDGKPRVVRWLRESPGGSEESLGESPGPLLPVGPLQASIIPGPCWAEAPLLGEGQHALQSILLLPPRDGPPLSRSIPIAGPWQDWPRDQRIPLTLNLQKGLWSPSLLVSHTPRPGSIAPCVGHGGQPPPLPPPARVRPYACCVCGKRFSLKHQMETHYRVHTGEKPFSCSLCPQRSRDFSAMTKHLRTHGAAPYRCPLCPAGCSSLASMQAHMRSHSPSQLPPGWSIRSTFLYSSSSSGSSRGPVVVPFPPPPDGVSAASTASA